MKQFKLCALIALFCFIVTSCGKSDSKDEEMELKYTIQVNNPDDKKALKFSDTEYPYNGPEIRLNSTGTTPCSLGMTEENDKINKVYLELNVACSAHHNKEIDAMTVALLTKDYKIKLSLVATPSSISELNNKIQECKVDAVVTHVVFETVSASEDELNKPEVQKLLKDIMEHHTTDDVEFTVAAGAVSYKAEATE